MKLLDKLHKVWYSNSMKYLILSVLFVAWLIALVVGIFGLAAISGIDSVQFYMLTNVLIPSVSISQTLAFLYLWEKFFETD